MKRLMQSESLAEVGHYRNLLEQAGIACVIRNEQLCGALGEIPFLECLPELWVVRDEQLQAARNLLEEMRKPVTGAPWRCRGCGQSNEAQFAVCWSCGLRDDDRG
ncbi:MAG TPA: DUF2007 domain-containing protein [Gammaproteobacteria bacterium]